MRYEKEANIAAAILASGALVFLLVGLDVGLGFQLVAAVTIASGLTVLVEDLHS